MPSKTQISPKDTRSSRRAAGSLGNAADGKGAAAAPAARARASWTERSTFQAIATRARIKRTIKPWWSSAAWNAETMARLLVLRPVLMPGMLR